MALPASHNTGTASVPAGGTAVTGQGTGWLTAGIQDGDIFIAGGLQAEILTVNSNTSITLKDAWPGSTRTADTYRVRYTPDAVRALTAMNAVLSSITGGNLFALSQLASAANKLPYFTGAGTAALADLTPAARAVLALTGVAGAKIPVVTGAGTAALRDIVGTVSQSGGTPTGAICERGSNANGSYVRFANGLQICTRRDALTGVAWTAVGSIYRTTVNVQWAASFSVRPSISGSVEESANYWLGAFQNSNDFAALQALAPVSGVSAITINAMAIGYWY